MTTMIASSTDTPGAVDRAGGGNTPPSGPIGRIVAGSVLLGLAGALFLTLIVFAGAAEHVITGSALLAFAVGWATLAVLSTRMTTQPQRWALVPAGSMAVVGTALLLFAPDDDALTTMGWLWPVPLLALAVWIAVRARRDLPSRTRRWLVHPVVAFLALGAVGGTYETVQQGRDDLADAMPGRSYDVGGHHLHLDCTGTGSPTVVLENGMGEVSASWAWITRAVAGDTRVCAYDRAGQGWSDDVSHPQDSEAIATDLRVLLERAGESGPYVFVGHSVGGAYALSHAAMYPEDVAGLVLLDATTPYAFTVLPDFPTTNSVMRRLLTVAPSLSRMGIARLVVTTSGSTLPEPAGDQVDAFAARARGTRSQRDELSQLRTSLTQAQSLIDLAGKPLAVVTAAEGQQAGWGASQDRLAALSSNSVHRVAPATHMSLVVEQGDSSNSVAAIADVVRAVRTGSPLPTS